MFLSANHREASVSPSPSLSVREKRMPFKTSISISLASYIALISLCLFIRASHQLSVDYYLKSCPKLEELVFSVTTQQFKEAPVSGPSTIRLFFHDCFVNGCDASILISGNGTEKEAYDNKNLAKEAFESVNRLKAVVESKCPGVVSCADILAIAARDFVHLAGGPNYPVLKGRKDGRVSLASNVRNNLPRPNSTVDDLLRLFASKGLNKTDLVALSGAHTIGFVHCDQFVSRLYDFRHTKQPDPSMEPRLLKALRMSCPPSGGNTDIVAPCDVMTPFTFDHMYYGNLEAKMGILATDQALFLDPRTQGLVQILSKDKLRFFEAFAQGMEKMGSIGIKFGNLGEIRRNCTRHN